MAAAIAWLPAYIDAMPQKPIELPPAIARRFVDDMRAFHAEPNAIKRDEIAARQLHALKQHRRDEGVDGRGGPANREKMTPPLAGPRQHTQDKKTALQPLNQPRIDQKPVESPRFSPALTSIENSVTAQHDRLLLRK